MSAPQYKKQKYNIDLCSNLISSIDNNTQAYDEILDEIYDYNTLYQFGYSSDTLNKSSFEDKYNDTDISDNLLELLDSNKNMQMQLKNVIIKEGESIQKSINKTTDAYKNQMRMSQYVNEEKSILETKTKQLSDDIYDDKRQIEINNYYYKKNKAQTRILYTFIILCIVIYFLTMIQNILGNLIGQSLFNIIIGILIAIFIIFLFYSLYDILLRDDLVFDEYINNWSGKTGVNINKEVEENNTENDNENIEQCVS